MTVAERAWTKDEIRALLVTPKAVERAVVAIFNKQTIDEQSAETTMHKNGVGFNGTDAEILSSFARQIIAGRHLSEKQYALAHKKIQKYAGQLTKIANQEL